MTKSFQSKIIEPCGLGRGELRYLSDETVMAHLQAGPPTPLPFCECGHFDADALLRLTEEDFAPVERTALSRFLAS